MPINYSYNEKMNLVSTKVTGDLYSGDIIDHLTSLINNDELQPDFIESADFNDIEDLILKYSDFSSISDMAKKLVKAHRLTIFSAYNEFSQAALGMMMPIFQSVELNVIVCKNEKEFAEHLDTFLNSDDQ